MSRDLPAIDRRLELLLDRALQGLDPAEAAELTRLTANHPDGADPMIELAAAAAALAGLGSTGHPDLPGQLAARLEKQATRQLAPPAARRSHPRGRVAPWLGWLVAAAALAVLATDRVSRPPAPPDGLPPVSVAPTSLADRLRSSPAVRLVATTHPLAAGAGGALVWDEARQEGVLRVEGLAPVDPRSGCYQLWIFDATRDARYPVDGGVFTVSRAAQPPIVEVRPRVPVREPTLFAITLEPPGGVVVSDRGRILLTAAWPAPARVEGARR